MDEHVGRRVRDLIEEGDRALERDDDAATARQRYEQALDVARAEKLEHRLGGIVAKRLSDLDQLDGGVPTGGAPAH